LSATGSSKVVSNINHVTILLDASSSMKRLAPDVVKVTDAQIQSLAERSKFHDQETRVTLYTFTHHGWGGSDIPCLIYDKDVLRMPSIAGLYHPEGWTPLADALTLAVADMRLIPEKYGDHSHLVYLFTDGFENKSDPGNLRRLPGLLREVEAQGNWTVAAFAPDAISKSHLVTHLGFHKDNIKVWDPDAEHAVEEAGAAMAAATDRFMKSRARGVRATTSLFSMRSPDVAEVKKALTPVTPGSYFFEEVTPEDLARIEAGRIDQFMQLKSGRPYTPDGRVFYQMTKRERIQHYKHVAVAVPDHGAKTVQVYTGRNARQLLGLPATESGQEVRVSPGRWKGYKVFVTTTSPNRRLLAGTSVMILR